jgi:hypothetical protein
VKTQPNRSDASYSEHDHLVAVVVTLSAFE